MDGLAGSRSDQFSKCFRPEERIGRKLHEIIVRPHNRAKLNIYDALIFDRRQFDPTRKIVPEELLLSRGGSAGRRSRS